MHQGQRGWRRHRRQAAASAGILFIGILGMVGLTALRRSPPIVDGGEVALRVDAMRLAPTNFPVQLPGYGTVRPLRRVVVAAEVTGRITSVHPSLRVGEVIGEGDVLFSIDDRDYRAAVDEATALAAQSEQTIERLEEELRRNRDRLGTARRNLALAQGEYNRMRDLFEQHQIGSQAELDGGERVLNTAKDVVDELDKLLAVAPMLIKESESAGRVAQARLERAQRTLERCTVRAPFRARVVRSLIERGQLVYSAAEMLVLADDSVLEIPVPLDARQAQRWLQFEPSREGELAWFPEVVPVDCEVRWTEAPDTHVWTGALHRVEQMSMETRMLRVVVRVEGQDAATDGRFPMVEGMFCSVSIPGKTLRDVYRVPRWAISVDQTVYLAQDDRLVTRSVGMAYTHQDAVLVDRGLTTGDTLVVTHLVNPLENMLLDVNLVDEKAAVR